MDKIVNSIKTQQQLDKFTSLIDTLSANIYKNTESFNKALLDDKSKTAKLLVTELSKPEVVNDMQEKQKVLDQLGIQLKTLKTIRLTIALPPTTEVIDLLSKWADKKLKGNFLFDINYDPSIIGGAQISYEGKYMDDSVIKRIEEVFKKDETQILEIANSQ